MNINLLPEITNKYKLNLIVRKLQKYTALTELKNVLLLVRFNNKICFNERFVIYLSTIVKLYIIYIYIYFLINEQINYYDAIIQLSNAYYERFSKSQKFIF